MEFIQPQIPDIKPTPYPTTPLRIWGDYAIYKQQCEAQLDVCNVDKSVIINSLKIKENFNRD